MTNGDKIRAMTDKELAAFIMRPEEGTGGLCAGKEVSNITDALCRACCLAWLQAPAKVEIVPEEWKRRIMQHFERVE